MKKANEMFSKDDRNWKMVVFRKKGSNEVLGFITRFNLQFLNPGIFPDKEASFFRIISAGNYNIKSNN